MSRAPAPGGAVARRGGAGVCKCCALASSPSPASQAAGVGPLAVRRRLGQSLDVVYMKGSGGSGVCDEEAEEEEEGGEERGRPESPRRRSGARG